MFKINAPVMTSLLVLAMGVGQAHAESAAAPIAANPAPVAVTVSPAPAAPAPVAEAPAPVPASAPVAAAPAPAPAPAGASKPGFQWPGHGMGPCAHDKMDENAAPCPYHGQRHGYGHQGMGPGMGQGRGPGQGMGPGRGSMMGMGPGDGLGMGMPPRGMGPGQGRGFGPNATTGEFMLPPRLQMLDLSDEQRTAIEKLLKEHADGRQEFMAKMQAAQARLGELHGAEKRDVDAIGAAYDEMFKVRREGIVSMLKLHDAIDALLTDEQRQRMGGMQRPRMLRR